MKRNVKGHFADPKSKREILDIKPNEFSLIISSLQDKYKNNSTSNDEKQLILKMLHEINQPYPGATY